MTVKSRIRRRKPSMLEHFKFLKSIAKRTPKFTMPSPAMLHARGDRASLKRTYPDLDEFWADLTQAYRGGDRRSVQGGLPLPADRRHDDRHVGDPKVQEQFKKLGDDRRRTGDVRRRG